MTVHSHSEENCHLKKGEQKHNNNENYKQSKKMFALVQDLRKQVKHLSKKKGKQKSDSDSESS